MKKRYGFTAMVLLAACLLGLVLPAMGAGPQKLASGTCGNSLTWALTDDGVLTISGTGDMYNYASVSNPAPWESRKDAVVSVVVKEGVTGIGSNAFYHHHSLKRVVIESGVTKIGAGAFMYCKNLEHVELPDSVTVIGVSAFRDCASLRSIRLPDGIKRIADHTFEGCESLRVVVIPKRVYEIAGGAFSRCESLWHILFKGTRSQWKRVTVATHRGDSSARVKDAVIHYKCTGDEVTDVEDKTCSICDPCTHKWDDGRIVQAATCAEDGEKLLTCTKCEETKTEAIPKTDTHSFGDWAKVDASFHGRSCTVCDLQESESHIWDEGRITKDAACMTVGAMTYTCTVCASTDVETIAATGHSYGDWTQVKAPTTEEMGLEEQTCGNCGDQQQRELAKLEPLPTEPTVPAESTQPQTQPTEPVEKQPDDFSAVLIVVIGAVGVLAIGGTAWMIALKKKRK